MRRKVAFGTFLLKRKKDANSAKFTLVNVKEDD